MRQRHLDVIESAMTYNSFTFPSPLFWFASGTEERVAKLEKELEERVIEKTEDGGDGGPLYESSSDAGIGSGNEVDDSLSEK